LSAAASVDALGVHGRVDHQPGFISDSAQMRVLAQRQLLQEQHDDEGHHPDRRGDQKHIVKGVGKGREDGLTYLRRQ
jgi:hypothetical protein